MIGLVYKAINLVSFLVVETLVWEVLLCASQDLGNNFSYDDLLLKIIKEVIVSDRGIMEKLDVDDVIGNETAVNKWIRESLDAHCVVI